MRLASAKTLLICRADNLNNSCTSHQHTIDEFLIVPPEGDKTVPTEDVISSFYESVNNKDDKWQALWSEDAMFSDAAGILDAHGRQAVIQSFTPFIKGVARLKVSQKIVEGQKACFIISYTYVNPKQQDLDQDVAEVWEVRDGKLAKLTIYFDLTAYRQFMRG